MNVRRERATSWISAFLVGLCIAVSAGAARRVRPQEAPIEPEALLSEEQRAEAARLLPLMNDAMRGEAEPAGLGVSLSLSFLKAQQRQVYVPFTLKLDPTTISQSITLYVRLAPAGMTLPPEPAAPDPNVSEPGTAPAPAPEPPAFPFEDVHFIDMPMAADAYVVRRAFAVLPGAYDLYLGVKDSELVETESAEIRRGVIKRTVEVPDLWSAELTTSSVFVTDRVEPIPAPLSPEQQRADPYAIGSARIVPRDVLQYEQTDTLSFLFFIYNPQLTENKPNVTVEYNFHQRTGGGDQFFNATSPQTLSAETLPPQFDMSLGHQLSAGQNVPLSAFPEGAYRLEIKVTDNTASASISRNVNFTVVGS